MELQKKNLPIVLGITGASGFIYGLRLLEFFLENDFKVDLVISNNSIKVAKYEMDLDIDGTNTESIKNSFIEYLETRTKINPDNLKLWSHSDIAASISSGSYKTQGMIIAPCSMGTLGNINAGTSNNLIARAADVVIKEGRKLVLLPRETPMSTIHLRNLFELSQMGVKIVPAAPGFYHNPRTIDDLVNHVLGKVLDQFDIDNELFKRWAKSSSCNPQLSS